MDIVAAYEQVGTYRGAAALCGTTHKTVKRVIERRRAAEAFDAPRRELAKNTDAVATVIAEKVRATDGRISAKRLLPLARAAGYTGSARNFRRAVAEAKRSWRRLRRVYRPWQPTPGEHLVIDWTTEGGWQIFCAMAPWSRWRFVRMAKDRTASTTMALIGECFEEMGGVMSVPRSGSHPEIAPRLTTAGRPGDMRRAGFAPLGLTRSQLLFGFVAAAYERRSLGIASHWPFEVVSAPRSGGI